MHERRNNPLRLLVGGPAEPRLDAAIGAQCLAYPPLQYVDAAAAAAQVAGADLCLVRGPLSEAKTLVRAVMRSRLPLVLTAAAGRDPRAVERLVVAAQKRRLATGVIGTLRLQPAAARLGEMLSGGGLGRCLGVRLVHAVDGVDTPGRELQEEVFQDLDLVRWLLDVPGGEECVTLGWDRGILRLDTEADRAIAAGDEPPAPGWREVVVHTELAEVRVCLAPPGARGGSQMIVERGGAVRHVRLPRSHSLDAELAIVLGTEPPWPCIPSVPECSACWHRAAFFCSTGVS